MKWKFQVGSLTHTVRFNKILSSQEVGKTKQCPKQTAEEIATPSLKLFPQQILPIRAGRLFTARME